MDTTKVSPYNGFQGESVRMTNKKFNEEFKKMVVELYRSGQSVKALSSEYGVSEVTIYN